MIMISILICQKHSQIHRRKVNQDNDMPVLAKGHTEIHDFTFTWKELDSLCEKYQKIDCLWHQN